MAINLELIFQSMIMADGAALNSAKHQSDDIQPLVQASPCCMSAITGLARRALQTMPVTDQVARDTCAAIATAMTIGVQLGMEAQKAEAAAEAAPKVTLQ